VIHYLIDASVAVDFYRPRNSFTPPIFFKHRALKRHITNQRYSRQAVIFIPAFCVAEVFNTFAKWWIRQRAVFRSQQQYENARQLFISHVHDRKFFYSCDLTRYHNLNCHEVFPVEHTTETEFQVTGLPTTTSWADLNKKLQETDAKDSVSKHYVSAFDILIIAMGMELQAIHGERVYLLTKDARLALVASQKPDFPKPLYWPNLSVSDLPAR
jgi:hypothetical protein